MKNLTKSQKAYICSISALLIASVLGFIQKNYLMGLTFLILIFIFIILVFSENNKK